MKQAAKLPKKCGSRRPLLIPVGGHTPGATGSNAERQTATTPVLELTASSSSSFRPLMSNGNLGCAAPASPLAVVVRK